MTFRDFLDDLELLWGAHAPTADRLRLHGHDDALAFLQSVVDEPHELARLRAIVGAELGHDLTHMTDADVLSAAAHFAESGRLLPSQPDHAHARGTPGGGPRPRAPSRLRAW